jgi:hypothetical protein
MFDVTNLPRYVGEYFESFVMVECKEKHKEKMKHVFREIVELLDEVFVLSTHDGKPLDYCYQKFKSCIYQRYWCHNRERKKWVFLTACSECEIMCLREKYVLSEVRLIKWLGIKVNTKRQILFRDILDKVVKIE